MLHTNIYEEVYENELFEHRETHKYKLGDLVELDTGATVYITRLMYDCDGKPLYGFSLTPLIDWCGLTIHDAICGYNETSIKRVVAHSDAIIRISIDTGSKDPRNAIHTYDCCLKDIYPLLTENIYRPTVDIDCTEEDLLRLSVEED